MILDMNISKILKNVYTIQSRNPITTGWGEIDEIVRGGLGKRELGVVIAATGSGKSMAMVHLGSRALVLGKP
jgi:KaiC/GvpD/RAD55 family RecA-like ATPase